MNNKDLRTLAEDAIAFDPDQAFVAIPVMPGDMLRLLDEVDRLSDLLAEEILEGSTELAAELRELDVVEPDVPEGFQEVDVNDLLSNPE